MQEILLLLLLASPLCGVKKLSSIGRSAGKGLRELKEPLDELKEAVAVEDSKEIRKIAGLT